MNLRQKSIREGLIIPEDRLDKSILACGCHHKQPSLHELELSARPHRWPEMRKLQARFFDDIMDKVTETEIQMLRILGLPSINEVRGKIAATKEFTYTAAQAKQLDAAADQLLIELLGRGFDPNAVYNYNQLNAFAIGLERTLGDVLKNKPEDVDDSLIQSLAVTPSLENRYLQAVIKDGGKRIKTEIAKNAMPILKAELEQMAREGTPAIEVARRLHNITGEGKAWYWLRIARSEAVLAAAAAFDAQSEAERIQYEEWSAAPTACEICSAFDGRTWKLGEGPQPVSDSHPHSVRKHCKIYTCDGWKRIDEIKVNDYVLSHTGKFRKVTKTHVHTEYDQPMVEVFYYNSPYAVGRKGERPISIDMSDNHPIWINGEWKEVRDIKVGDKIQLLATRCPVCNKLMPYSRWRSDRGEKANYCSLYCSNKVMDNWVHRPKEETKHIRKKISDYKTNNNPMHDINNRNKMRDTKIKQYLENPKIKKQMSEARKRFHKENPLFTKNAINKWRKENPEKYKLVKIRQAKSLKAHWENNPGKTKDAQLKWQRENPKAFEQVREKSRRTAKKMLKERGNFLLAGYLKWREENPSKAREALCKSAKTIAGNNWVSKPQERLFDLIKQHYPEAVLNMPIQTNTGMRFGDVVLPEHNIILEYDGQRWHQDEQKELSRDLELEFSGYNVLHFDKTNWETAPKQVERLIANHNDNYEFVEVEVAKVRKFTENKITLYNLSVDQDESYIAKGFVVHNCLCIRIPLYYAQTPVQKPWERESPYDRPYRRDELFGNPEQGIPSLIERLRLERR